MQRSRFSFRAGLAGMMLAGGLTGCSGGGRVAALAGQVDTGSLERAANRYLKLPDVTLRYREIGRGEPVVLLHGYVDRLEMWYGVADSIARTHRVIVPDLRGFGESIPAAEAPYGRVMRADVVALLDHLGITQAHLIGYSLGALLAAGVALEQPDRVASATLVAGPFYPDSIAAVRDLQPFVRQLEQGRGLAGFFRWIAPTIPDSTIEPLARQIYDANDRRAMIEALRTLPALTLPWHRLDRLQVPAVAVVGRTDPLLGYSRAIAARWPGIKLVELAEADHVVVFGVPEVVSEFRAIAARAGRQLAHRSNDP